MALSGSRRSDALLVGATITLAVVLYPGALLRGEAFFERDLHLDWYPRVAALGRSLGAGSWPLWDLSIGFGRPQLADPSAQVLYPAAWLAAALPWSVAYTVYVLLHLLIGALGTGHLAARLGADRRGALAAGALWVLSGPVQSALNLWHHFAGAAWMAWVVLAFDRLALHPSRRSVLALAAVVAAQVLAGSADACAMSLALGAAAAALRVLARPKGRRAAGPVLAGSGVALALAAALSSLQWWPTLEAVAASSRRDLDEEVRTAWSVPLAGLGRLVAPLDPARVPFEPGRWEKLYERPAPPFLFSAYLGLPALGLAAAALLPGPHRRRALVLAGAGAVAIAFSMGPHGPVYGPLTVILPFLRVFRYPSKALLVASLMVALLAGLGVRALSRPLAARRGRILVAATLAGLSLASLVVTKLYWAPGSFPWPSLAGLLAAFPLVLPARSVRPALAAIAVVVLAVADLLAAHRDLNATAPVGLVLEPPPVVGLVRRDDGRRLYVYDYHTLPGTAERLLGRSEPYWLAGAAPSVDRRVLACAAQRQFLVPPSAGFFGLESSYDLDTRGLHRRDLNDLDFFLRLTEGTPLHARLLRMGAVANVLALHRRGLEDLELAHVVPSLIGDPILVFRVPGACPRAWLVGRTRVAAGEASFRALADPSFDPAEEAILANGPRLAGPLGFRGEVTWGERRPDRARLAATAEEPAVLVLADAWDPGWRARVDGASVPVLRANIAFLGVALPAGHHTVELVYRPAEVSRALALSAVGLLAVAGLALTGRRRPRQ